MPKQEIKDHEVTINNNWKRFRSPHYNFDFNLENGYFARWGSTKEEDPKFSPFGPEILDLEVTTKCYGIQGKFCSYCYKSNNSSGQNLHFNNFKKIIDNVNYNNQLTQVAFGLGSTAEENPDLWRMCDYLRQNNIIPNGTVACLSDETAKKIAYNFGAVAVSEHSNLEVFLDTINKLNHYRNDQKAIIKQINVHYMIAEETFDDCKKLLKMLKEGKIKGINALVLLSLKKKGRAEVNNFHQLSEEKFNALVCYALINNIGIGFDSCSEFRFANAIKKLIKDPKIVSQYLQYAEPCESFGLFSSYINCNGDYFPCSFAENIFDGINVIDKHNFKDVWESQFVNFGREISLKNNRKCLCYQISADDPIDKIIKKCTCSDDLKVKECEFAKE
jgi:hypothetical protein